MKYAKKLKSDELKWSVWDLDGTLAKSIYPKEGIGAPIIKNVRIALNRVKAGKKIIIYTARPWSDYENLERWCKDNGIPARRIICGKPLACEYWDDRNKMIK